MLACMLTLLDYTPESLEILRVLPPIVKYVAFSRTLLDSGPTTVLHAYVKFHRPTSIDTVRETLPRGAVLSPVLLSPQAIRSYISSASDFEEYGTFPRQGRRTDKEVPVAVPDPRGGSPG